MKKKWAKIAVSVILCVVLISSLPLAVFGATAAVEKGAYPVILVNNYNHNALYSNPNTPRQQKEFPPDINSDLQFVKWLVDYIVGPAELEYTLATASIFSQVDGWFKNIKCNYDGTSQYGGMGPLSMNGYPMSAYQNNEELIEAIAGDTGKMLAEELGPDMVYVFSYDWRLDPLVHAGELNDLVKQVKKDTGYDKVTILSDGYGSTIASAYLNKYASLYNYSDIKNYVTLDSTAMGVTLIGDLFSGRIDTDPNGLSRYFDDLADNIPVGAAITLVNRILNKDWVHYEVTAKLDAYLLVEKNNIYDTWVRDIINVMPGLWALVPYDTFDDAMAFMYPAGHQPVNNDLLSSIKEYHVIQGYASDTLRDAQEKGVNVSVVSAYGMQSLPVTEYATVETGNGIVDTRYSSYSAYTAFNNNDWVGKGLYQQVIDDGHDHTNKSKNPYTKGFTVDASTCALPENTWFIYGMKNDYWDYESDGQYYFIMWLVNADEQRTVHDSPYYPQFMEYNRYSVPGNLYGLNSRDYKRFILTGDTNLDGQVTAADARLALRHSAKLTTLTRAALTNGDIDGDGKITAAEARKILRVSSQLDTFKNTELPEDD